MKLVIDSCIDNFPISDDPNNQNNLNEKSNTLNNYLIDIVKISKENFIVDCVSFNF